MNIVPPFFISGSARCAMRMNDQHETSIVFRKPSRPTSTTRPCKASFGENAIECSRKSSCPHSFSIRSNTCFGLPLDHDVERHEDRRFQRLRQRLDMLLGALVQIGDGELGAQGAKRLGATPGDRLVVGDADDQAFFALQRDLGLGKYGNS